MGVFWDYRLIIYTNRNRRDNLVKYKEVNTMLDIQIPVFLKLTATDNALDDYYEAKKNAKEMETMLPGFYFFVPGNTYYVVSGDGTCKYATKILSISMDEKGTHIYHKMFKVSNGSIYATSTRKGTSGPFKLDGGTSHVGYRYHDDDDDL